MTEQQAAEWDAAQPDPALDDAPPMVIIPICLSVHELCRLMANRPNVEQHAIGRAWGKVQLNLWQKPQNWKGN